MTELIQPVADTGFTILYQPQTEPKMDIIFVHGLQGHPRDTWSTRHVGGESKTPLSWFFKRSYKDEASSGAGNSAAGPVFWPKDLLQHDCPECRIMTWGYDSRVSKFFSGPTNQNNFFDHAKNLLYAIDRERSDCQGRGIIFVAHSLGGIVVKEVLRRAQYDDEQSIPDIYRSTRGICFLGTPHRGSSLAPLGNTARRIVSAVGFDTNDRNLKALQFDSIESELSREEFTKSWRSGSFEIRTFQESQGMTGLNGLNGKVVPDFSSTMDDTRERAQHIDANHMEMCRFESKDTTGYRQVAGEIKGLVQKYANLNKAKQVQRLLATNESLDLIDIENGILESLAFPEMDSRCQRIEKPSSNTCGWLTSLPTYQKWYTEGTSFIWLKGKVGAGKSTLIKSAFEEAQNEKWPSGSIVAGYFHDMGGVPLERSFLGLLRSLAYQFFVQDRALLSEYVGSTRRHQNRDRVPQRRPEWTQEALQDLCVNATKRYRHSPIYIFIDALDEGETSQTRKLLRFWEQTMSTAASHGVELRICLSSRHYPNVTLHGCPEILVERHNMTDILTHVHHMLKSDASDQETQELITIILSKASGVFLWVVLVVEILLKADDDGESFAQKRARLQQLPRELEELFTLIVAGVSDEERHDTFQLLKLITVARRPLRPIEICFALALEMHSPIFSLTDWKNSRDYVKSEDQMSKILRTRSKGLVEIKSLDPQRAGTTYSHDCGPPVVRVKEVAVEKVFEQPDSSEANDAHPSSARISAAGITAGIYFIHESLAEFMCRKGLKILADTNNENALGQCHRDLALSCLKYLSNPHLRHVTNTKTGSPLVGLPHAPDGPSETQPSSNRTPRRSIHEALVASDTKASTNLQSLETQLERIFGIQDKRTDFPFLQYSVTALFHHAQAAERLDISLASLVEGLSGQSTWVFDCWVALAREFSSNQLIMYEGDGGTLLQLFVAANIRSGVKILLQQPALRSQLEIDRALRIAASAGITTVAEDLLTAGARPAASNDLGHTALHLAAKRNRPLIARLLLQRHTPTDTTTTFGWTALHWAAENGHSQVLQELLNAKANTEIRNADGETPILVASRRGHLFIVEALFEAGALTDAVDNLGRTILHLATRFKHGQVLQFLLTKNLSIINLPARDGRTALQYLQDPVPDVPERSMTASPDPWQMSRVKTGSPLPKLGLPERCEEPPWKRRRLSSNIS